MDNFSGDQLLDNFTVGSQMDNLTNQTPHGFSFPSCYDDNLNTTHVTAARWETHDRKSDLVTAVVLLAFMVIGVPGNLLIIVSMFWKKLYRQPAHILLLNLAFNDFLMCVTYIPINIVSAIAGEYIFGSNDVTRCHVCQTGVLFVIFAHFNLHILALLSLDRFLYIKLPLRYERVVTVRITLITVIITWVFCILLSIPTLFKFGEIGFTASIATCSLFLLGRTDLTENIYYEVFSIAEAFVLPLAVLFITNVWAVAIVKRQLKKIYNRRKMMLEEGKISDLNRTENKKQLRLVKIYGAILISNLFTWTPNLVNISVLFVLIHKPFPISPLFFVCNYLCFLSQVVIHPFIQTWLISDIRQTVTALCIKCKRKKQDPYLDEVTCCGCCDILGAAILPVGGTFEFSVKRVMTTASTPIQAIS